MLLQEVINNTETTLPETVLKWNKIIPLYKARVTKWIPNVVKGWSRYSVTLFLELTSRFLTYSVKIKIELI